MADLYKFASDDRGIDLVGMMDLVGGPTNYHIGFGVFLALGAIIMVREREHVRLNFRTLAWVLAGTLLLYLGWLILVAIAIVLLVMALFESIAGRVR